MTTASEILSDFAGKRLDYFVSGFGTSGTLEYACGRKDREGITLHHELKRTGWLATEPVGARKIHSYVEYHIEQGPILESKHKSVGVVTPCQGQSWLESL